MKAVVTRIDLNLRNEVDKFIEEYYQNIGYHITQFDFVNCAVEEKLKKDRMKFKKSRGKTHRYDLNYDKIQGTKKEERL